MSLSDEEDFSDIRAYFSEAEWVRLQRCEKVHYRNMKTNHQAMLDMGLNPITPVFMRRNRTRRVAESPGVDKRSDSEKWILHLLRRSPGNKQTPSCSETSCHTNQKPSQQGVEEGNKEEGEFLVSEVEGTVNESPQKVKWSVCGSLHKCHLSIQRWFNFCVLITKAAKYRLCQKRKKVQFVWLENDFSLLSALGLDNNSISIYIAI
ncbi:uncharacterized protein [Paramormyrops kingsleyae]|uniref:uncharacterized protein n=1 Tax=Paramormyrops kingsleyae TaxID=1676925 RepID=UPI003B977B9D